jgi:hypothetical protein
MDSTTATTMKGHASASISPFNVNSLKIRSGRPRW